MKLLPSTPRRPKLSTANGKFMAPFVEGHMSRTSVVLTLARLGGRGSSSIVISTASPQVYLCRLRVCVGDVQQDEFASVFPVRSVPKTSSPDDYVHQQVPVCSEWLAALPLERNSEPFVREIARRSGWCFFPCAPALGQVCGCRTSTSTASQQGHLIATCSSIL